MHSQLLSRPPAGYIRRALIRDFLESELRAAVGCLIASGELQPGDYPTPTISDAKEASHGDYSCQFALAAAKIAGLPPREIASRLAEQLPPGELLDSTEVAGPGFLNLRLKPAAIARFVKEVLEKGEELPRTVAESPVRLNVEFVSVNPNGPITVGSGRGAAFGSTLCNVLEAAGHKVHREYYINDGTNSEQMRLFAESVRAYLNAAFSLPMPTERPRYAADYVRAIAGQLLESRGQGVLALMFFATIRPRLIRDFNYLGGLHIEFQGDSIGVQVDQGTLDRTEAFVRQIFERGLDIGQQIIEAFAGVEEYRSRTEHLLFAGLLLAVLESQEGSDTAPHIQRCAEEGGGSECWQDLVANLTSVAMEFAFDPLMNDARLLAQGLLAEHFQNVQSLSDEELRSIAETSMIQAQREDLEAFGVTFHTWFSEQSLHDSGKVQECIDALIAKGAADSEPYQLEVIRKKGEPDEVKRNEQPIEEDEELEPANEPALHSDPVHLDEGHETAKSPLPSAPGKESGANAATLWLRSTKFADDKDRVLKRKDGRWTYIASDVAYHKSKFDRGNAPDPNGAVESADKLLTILGPDHHGYIGRLRAVVAALLEERAQEKATADASSPLSETEALVYRNPAERDACLAALDEAKKKLEVVIFQIVRFVKDGKPAPMRKRDGNIYSLRDLMLEIGKNAAPEAEESEQLRIGKDVARFFYLMRSHDTHMDFDLDLAEKQSDENPVYYVQYAHARICSVLRKAEENGLRVPGPQDPFDPSLLAEPKELALIKKVCDLPFEVRRCAEDYGVHRMTSYATELARAYHAFYDSCRVLQPENPPLTQARLALCQAAALGLRSTLGLLGISAPERM